MKNKDYSYLIIFIVLLIIATIINIFVFGFNSINHKLLDKKWYHYDYSTGYYDILNFYGDKVIYNSSNTEKIYNECIIYNYDKKKNILNFDCGKKIKIRKVNNSNIELNIDDYDKVFFDNIEDSLNYEFKNYFGKSIVDYKEDKNQVTEYSKINEERLINILKDKGYSKIIFIGNNCTSVDCILALDIMEKWIIKNSSVYFFDSNDINSKLLTKASKIILDIPQDINFYNGVYPKVLEIKNNKIIDIYDIKCVGFNCSNLYKTDIKE